MERMASMSRVGPDLVGRMWSGGKLELTFCAPSRPEPYLSSHPASPPACLDAASEAAVTCDWDQEDDSPAISSAGWATDQLQAVCVRPPGELTRRRTRERCSHQG